MVIDILEAFALWRDEGIAADRLKYHHRSCRWAHRTSILVKFEVDLVYNNASG